MKAKTKKILLIVFIILLIIINLSALTTIYYHKKIRDKRTENYRNSNEQSHINGMHRFIKEELKLDSLQFEQFKELYYKNANKSQKIAENLDLCRKNILSEVAKENPNLDELDRLSSQIGELHYELKKRSINHFLELKEICREDQQEDLDKLFMHMMERQDNRNNPGNHRERNGKKRKGRQNRHN